MTDLLSLDTIERFEAYKKTFVKTSVVKAVLADFDRLRYNKTFGGEQQCMLLTGDTGAGKSELIKYYKAQYNDNVNRGFVECPVLLSNIISSRSLDAMIKQLLYDFDVFGAEKLKRSQNAISDISLLIKNLRKAKTQLIIIDNFQVLVERKTSKNLNDIANTLKYINEEAGVAIVLVGMPWAECIANEPGWSSRLVTRKLIPYFKLSSQEEFDTFLIVLIKLGLKMPFTKPVKRAFFSPKITYQLIVACKGCFRTLRHILDEAVKIALFEKAETLAAEHLSKAYSLISSQENPFEQSPDSIKALEVAEYSQYKYDVDSGDEVISKTEFIDSIPFSQLLVKSKSTKKKVKQN